MNIKLLVLSLSAFFAPTNCFSFYTPSSKSVAIACVRLTYEQICQISCNIFNYSRKTSKNAWYALSRKVSEEKIIQLAWLKIANEFDDEFEVIKKYNHDQIQSIIHEFKSLELEDLSNLSASLIKRAQNLKACLETSFIQTSYKIDALENLSDEQKDMVQAKLIGYISKFWQQEWLLVKKACIKKINRFATKMLPNFDQLNLGK